MKFIDYLLCVQFDWSICWAFITAIATLLLVLVGWVQLNAIQKTNKEIFLNNLKRDFFTEQERKIFLLIELNALNFEIKKIETEGIEKSILLGIFITNLNKSLLDVFEKTIEFPPQYTTHEIDDFLLQHFEDLGLLFRKKILNLYDIEQTFGYYVSTCYNYSAIHEYIKWARTDDNDIYSNFEFLSKELDALKRADNK